MLPERQQLVLQDLPGVRSLVHEVQLGQNTDSTQTWGQVRHNETLHRDYYYTESLNLHNIKLVEYASYNNGKRKETKTW